MNRLRTDIRQAWEIVSSQLPALAACMLCVSALSAARGLAGVRPAFSRLRLYDMLLPLAVFLLGFLSAVVFAYAYALLAAAIRGNGTRITLQDGARLFSERWYLAAGYGLFAAGVQMPFPDPVRDTVVCLVAAVGLCLRRGPAGPRVVARLATAVTVSFLSRVAVVAFFEVTGPDYWLLDASLYRAIDMLGFVLAGMAVAFSPAGGRRLVLVSPAWAGFWGAIAGRMLGVYPPFFLVLRAHTPTGYAVSECIRGMWQSRFVRQGDLVAVSCYSSNAYRAYAIAKRCRRAGATVVMGGPHVSAHPDEALMFCDSVVIGEAEAVWEHVVRDAQAGVLKTRYAADAADDYYRKTHELLLRVPLKESLSYIETTRGCRHRCIFCSTPVQSRRIRHKPVEQVLEHIRYVAAGRVGLGFIDNNLYAEEGYARRLFAAMEPCGVAWSGFASIDMAGDEELLKAAVRSGCRELTIGYEFAQELRDTSVSGKLHFFERFASYSRRIREQGIRIRAGFIFGFDVPPAAYMRALWALLWRIRAATAAVTFLTPLPGTSLFDQLLSDGRIRTLNWRWYDVRHLTFTPCYPGIWFSGPAFFLIRYGTFVCLSWCGWIFAGAVILLAICIYRLGAGYGW